MKNEQEIFNRLKNGCTVREVSKYLGVSTTTVQAVRKKHPDIFPPNAKKGHAKRYQKKGVQKKVLIAGRVPPEIWSKIEKTMRLKGLTQTEFLERFFKANFYEEPHDFRFSQKDCDCVELSKPDCKINQCPDCGFFMPF